MIGGVTDFYPPTIVLHCLTAKNKTVFYSGLKSDIKCWWVIVGSLMVAFIGITCVLAKPASLDYYTYSSFVGVSRLDVN
jgi:hypothetical protein